MQDQLRAQKQVSQGRAVYCLGIRYDAPGIFFLGHILRECLRLQLFCSTFLRFCSAACGILGRVAVMSLPESRTGAEMRINSACLQVPDVARR